MEGRPGKLAERKKSADGTSETQLQIKKSFANQKKTLLGLC
jgi:hypothetical protein